MVFEIEEYDFQPRTKEKDPVAFLTTLERTTLPLTAAQKRSIAPNKYDHAHLTSAFSRSFNQVTSQHGYGVRFAPRFKDIEEITPGPGQYEPPIISKTAKPCAKPFGIGQPRITMKFNKNPGVGNYDSYKSVNKRVEYKQHFFKKEFIPAVEVKCIPYNTDKCEMCGEKPLGDYWQYHHKEYLCRRCMEELKKERTARNYIKLESFQKIRDCSFMHSHERTSAKVTTMDMKAVHKIQMKEAYLSKYFK